jgi:hypothetical protein
LLHRRRYEFLRVNITVQFSHDSNHQQILHTRYLILSFKNQQLSNWNKLKKAKEKKQNATLTYNPQDSHFLDVEFQARFISYDEIKN